MCEETAVSYKIGDVVWAKLGPCWWPGEVVSFEELPSDIINSFKKPPLAVVKFFDEEKYEFVKQLTHIHSYNTNRKYDFIKKGMDLYRAKHSFMEKFPGDVCSAERKTDGNPNILDDPRVAPDKKKNYSAIFGSPLRKKGAKDSPRSRGRSSIGKIQSSTSTKKIFSLITHPRFLGNDDSEVKLLVQTPSASTLPQAEYRCYSCDFKANRIDVIILHNRSHLRRPNQTTKSKSPSKKSKKTQLPTSKTETIEEDLALLKQGLPHCSDNEAISSGSSDSESEESDDEPLVKKKPKPKSPPKSKKQQKTPPVPEVKKQTDIRTDLLAEWDDDDDEEEEEEAATKKVETSITESEGTKNEKEPPKSEDKSKSCFDFVEDEEDVITTMEGRRLPRVIPPTDKRKSIHELEKEMSRKSRTPSPHSHESMDVDESSELNVEKEKENSENDSIRKKDSQFQLEFEAFNHALKELTVPDIPHVDKYEQNFPEAKTIKFPDKPDKEMEISEIPPDIQSPPGETSKHEKKEENDKKIEEKPIEIKIEIPANIKEPIVKKSEVATKLTNPKKRFVKTFEDETKNSTVKESVVQEQKRDPSPEPAKSDCDALEVANLKTKLMKKLVDSPPKKETGRQTEKPRKNVPRSKKLRAPIEIVKEVVEDKNNKRAHTDSNNDYDIKPHAKRKRFSVQTKEVEEVIDESKKEIPMDVKNLNKKDIKDKVEETIESNRVTLENVRSSTSSLLSDLNVEEDELLNANILSESQKLTIQNIIGVNSPILTAPSASVENASTDDNAESNVDKEELKEEISTIDSTISNEDRKEIKDLTATDEFKKDTSEKSANELSVEETSNKEDIIDKPLNIEMEIEENIDIANNQILELTDKLSTEISENLPEEIIEEPVEKAQSKTEEKNKETEEIFPESTKGADEVIKKENRRPKDPIKKVSEEKFEKFLEENFSKSCETKTDPPKKLVIELEKMTEEEIKSPIKEIDKNEDEQNTTIDIEVVIRPEESLEDKKDDEAVTEDKNLEQQENEMNRVVDDILAIKPDDEMEIEVSNESIEKNRTDLAKSMFSEDEMVNIEGNLTVVTETDLADKQVEITATQEVSKPITLSNFSMDFCEDVDSYIKGDDIMPSFPRSSSTSPIPLKEKIAPKEDTQKDIEDIKLDSNSSVEENLENVPKIGDVIIDESSKIIESVELQPNETKPQSELKEMDIESNMQIETDHANGKTKVSLKLEDIIIKPIAKDDSTKVITEDVEPTLKSEEITDLNIENLLKESPKEKKMDDVPANKETTKEIMQKEEIIVPPMDISVESEVAKITDSLIEQEVVIQDVHPNTTSTKLLEILTDRPKSSSAKSSPVFAINTTPEEKVITTGKQSYKQTKFLTKTTAGPSKLPKTTILDNKLIKPFDDSKTVSVKKVTKRTYQDVEDIDTFIIQKPAKKLNVSIEPESPTPKMIKKPVISKGKARILQQTIITPTGDILQPPVTQPQPDDNMFDINSMPIVLSDQILTPESIENMQIVLQDNAKPQINPIKKQVVTTTPQQIKLLNKNQSPTTLTGTILKNPTPSKTYISKQQKIQKVYPSGSPKVMKSNTSVITQPGKQGKFIIVPSSSTPTGTKYTVGKRPSIVKKPPQKVITPITKAQDSPMTSAGNKIMILKSQGQQQKILVTAPSQQKQTPVKLKGRPLGHKQIATKESPHSKANIISQTIVNSKGQITTVPTPAMTAGNRGQVIAAIAQQNRSIKLDPTRLKRPQQQRVYIQHSEITKPSTSGQRTIIIKNPQGQTVKKIQGTDDALLDQQVAEQLQAISRASATQHIKEYSPKTAAKIPVKKSYSKKQETIKQPVTSKTVLPSTQSPTKNVSVPPLAPISPIKKAEAQLTDSTEPKVAVEKTEEVKRPPHQLVIQDAQGNQTTITEGQILALPSEAIDGQPHSYVLVTLDETGNLTPLNSEALMSLDPNLNLTSDLGNMVLQIDQGANAESETKVQLPVPIAQEQVESSSKQNIKEVVEKTSPPPPPPPPPPPQPVAENVLLNETPQVEGDQNVQAVINSSEMGQLIITGDAATAQKFLESLAEGNADLANLLANAEGNVLIQADGQQILINTDSENSMLVMNPEGMSAENSEGSGNPIFASQPVKNQDILAAALADTDVFQQDQSISHSPSKVAQSQLSPNSALYPMNVGNVLETNSMNSPIMTPLEVPSTNTKKIDDENEILTQVPKNVDLPITITDPNISQTVAPQQLLAAEIPTNLDLPLTIQDSGISVTSAGMNSPSFVYSLPTLDDTVDINQKAFTGSISMPLLTEEPEESIAESSSSSETLAKNIENEKKDKSENKKRPKRSISPRSPKSGDKKGESDDKKTDFMETGGLCAMRGSMCNSLSEPPPDMFDFTETQTYEAPHISETPDMDIPIATTPASEIGNTVNDQESVSSIDERKTDDATLYTINTTSPSTNTDDSCEIPLQPLIIAKPFEENGTSDSKFGEEKIATDGDV